MTDQLPRQIPQDPAEQEAQMPEWVKVETLRRVNERPSFAKSTDHRIAPAYNEAWSHALTIWQWMPKPVDREAAATEEIFEKYATCSYSSIRGLIAEAIKRGRELEREAGK